MSEPTNFSYAAQITISLPGKGESVTMTVTLWPADVVDVDGMARPLGECTLADLERYAKELEADVWDAYESILLPELDADEAIELEISLADKTAGSDADWRQFNLVVAPEMGDERNDESASQHDHIDQAELPEEEHEAPFVPEVVAVELADAEEGTEAPDVAVAEPEQVYPEIEEEVGEVLPSPEIVPSRARVRVAGKRLPLNDPTWAAVDIFIDEPALRAAQAHALSSLDREVAGVLLGSLPEKQPDGRYLVHIFDTIVARHTVMQGASVTYTPESWRYLNDTLAERYPDETTVMVGWYHTHPGFGIFLSGMDLFIHQNFFTQIWHVALVLDPRARKSGFFCWDRQKTRVGRHEFAWPFWAANSW